MKFQRGISVQKSINIGPKRKILNPDWQNLPSGCYFINCFEESYPNGRVKLESFGTVRWDKESNTATLLKGWVNNREFLGYSAVKEHGHIFHPPDFLSSREFSVQYIGDHQKKVDK